MKVEMVPPSIIGSIWPLVVEHIEKSFTAEVTPYSIEDIRTECESEQAQLWVIYDEGKIFAAFISSVISGSNASVLQLSHLAGEGIDQWIEEFDKALTDFCKKTNCVSYEADCRPGFGRLIPGAIEESRHYVKHVNLE